MIESVNCSAALHEVLLPSPCLMRPPVERLLGFITGRTVAEVAGRVRKFFGKFAEIFAGPHRIVARANGNFISRRAVSSEHRRLFWWPLRLDYGVPATLPAKLASAPDTNRHARNRLAGIQG